MKIEFSNMAHKKSSLDRAINVMTKADVTITDNGFIMNGFKVIKGSDGHFVQFPNNVRVSDKKLSKVTNMVLQEYVAELSKM